MIEDYDKPLLPDGPPPELPPEEHAERARKFHESFAIVGVDWGRTDDVCVFVNMPKEPADE